MELKAYKKEVEKIFLQNNIDKQEVNILFCEALNLSTTKLLMQETISQKQKKTIERAIKKRLTGTPIQKIFKRAYFLNYVFFVNKNVLCPRPETELLVLEALKTAKSGDEILDLCTGSGAIAVSLKKELSEKFGNENINVFASDISPKALSVAKKNAKKYCAKVTFVCSNMFDKFEKKGKANKLFDIIVSNPPYIKTADIDFLDVEVKDHDPKISLDGGEDGLEFYRIICSKAKQHLRPHGKVFVEVGAGEAQIVKSMFEKNGFASYTKNDYNNIERIVVGELL